MNPRSFNFPTW